MEKVRKPVSNLVTESFVGTDARVLMQTFWIVFFAVLTAAGAQVQIPHQPVPYTLQTFFVLLGAAFLGSRNASLSQAFYLGLGIVGMPVFTGGEFGLARLIGPTGGYLLSFPIASMLVGYLVCLRQGFVWTLIAMFLGLLVIFTIGASYLNLLFVHDFRQAFVNGFLIFSWWDLLKLSAAAAIYNEFSKRYRRLPSR